MAVTVVGSQNVSVAVTNGIGAGVTVAGGGSVGVSVTGGVGPTIIVNGVSTSVVGYAGVQPFIAGQNITLTTAGGGITILAANPPVYSVQGKVGTVVLSVTDITAAPAIHTHSTAQISGLTAAIQANGKVSSVQGRTGTITISRADITAAASVHTHSTSDISSFVSAVQANSAVQSVQGKNGVVVLSAAEVGAAAESHGHTVEQISDFAAGVAANSPVQSVNGLTGEVVVDSLPGQGENAGKLLSTDGTASNWITKFSAVSSVISAGTNVTLNPSEESGTIEISSGGGLSWASVPSSPYSVIGEPGQIARDSNYLYVCVGSGYDKTWKRADLSTWVTTDPQFSNVELLLHLNGDYWNPIPLVDTSSRERTVNTIGSVTQYPGPTQYTPGYGVFGGAVSFSGGGYLSIPYAAAWDLGASFSIEFWIKISSFPASRKKIIGTNGWGIFITPQSEQNYGTPYRLESIEFSDENEITQRTDCGPISLNAWTYVFRGSTISKVGTTPGNAMQWENFGYFSAFGSMSAYNSPLTIGGDSSGSVNCYMDEIRITVPGRNTEIVPSAPFPDA